MSSFRVQVGARRHGLCSFELPTSVEQLEVRQPTVELETIPSVPVPEHLQMRPVSGPPQSSETTEPRAEQPRLGERVYPTQLPLSILPTPLSRRTSGTVQQVVETAEDPEEKEEEMVLVATMARGPRSEGCLLLGAQREIHPSSPEWSTPTLQKGAKLKRTC